VERDGDHLVLRPHNQAHPVSMLPLEGRDVSEMIVGRVCHVAIETWRDRGSRVLLRPITRRPHYPIQL